METQRSLWSASRSARWTDAPHLLLAPGGYQGSGVVAELGAKVLIWVGYTYGLKHLTVDTSWKRLAVICVQQPMIAI